MSVKVEVFSTSTCPHCPAAIAAAESAKEVLGDKMDLESVKIDQSPENQKRAMEYQIMAVPTVVINGEVQQPGGIPTEDLISKIESLL